MNGHELFPIITWPNTSQLGQLSIALMSQLLGGLFSPRDNCKKQSQQVSFFSKYGSTSQILGWVSLPPNSTQTENAIQYVGIKAVLSVRKHLT